MNKLRVLNIGNVTPQVDQAIDSLLLEERLNDEIIDTLCFASPSEYVWLGELGDKTELINQDFCKVNNIPVVRAFTMGGAYVVPSNSLTFCLVINETRTLNRVRALKTFMHSLEQTFASLKGTREGNDILVNGRKISGSSVDALRKVIYLESAININFNYGRANRILTKKGRENKTLKDWVTSIEAEAGIASPLTNKEHLIYRITKQLIHDFDFEPVTAGYTKKEKELVGIASME